ncbi:sporulation protein YjcZ [Cohnella panacarvi]|nr:sporulation protein YjcZ [Cohnella panacarvi]MBO9596774.1 sporulation protein YjcZ [Cohnella sp.]
MSYPVAGAVGCGHGVMGTAAFVLVLFILLVIILRAGY